MTTIIDHVVEEGQMALFFFVVYGTYPELTNSQLKATTLYRRRVLTMRSPKIDLKAYAETSHDEVVIKHIDEDSLEPIEFDPAFDFDNPKELRRAMNEYKKTVRGSFEYKTRLIPFLKVHRGMNKSMFFKGIEDVADKKFSIEIHHTPFTLEDIVYAVARKRQEMGESLDALEVAHEVMYLHFTGQVGLVPLDKTTHSLIHSENAPEVFVPLQFIDDPWDFHAFYKEYKKWIPDSTRENYEYLQDLSVRYEKFEDIIPNYMKPKMLYYECPGFLKVDAFEKVLHDIKRDKGYM
jgi:hypothetical protein